MCSWMTAIRVQEPKIQEECGYRIILTDSTSQTFIWNRTMNTRTSPRREDKPFWCIPLTPRPCLKGVMIEHRNITGSVNVSTDWGFNESDVVCTLCKLQLCGFCL